MSSANSTARFCPKCQTETDRYVTGACKACATARSADWRAANPEKHKVNVASWTKANPDKVKASKEAYRAANHNKLRVRDAAYRAANLEKIKAYGAAYRAANPEKEKARHAAWEKANPDKVKMKTLAWHTANPDKARASSTAWKKANPKAGRIHDQNRNARKRENGGVLSKDLSAKLFKLQKGKCACCKQPLGENYHLDHVMPIALGGPNVDSNMQLLRQRCNNQKHAKHPVQFMQERGFLL